MLCDLHFILSKQGPTIESKGFMMGEVEIPFDSVAVLWCWLVAKIVSAMLYLNGCSDLLS